MVRQYRLGWAPGGLGPAGALAWACRAAALVDAGLATVDESGRYTDFFRGACSFPSSRPAAGRSAPAAGCCPAGRRPKYKNTPGTAVYDKSRVLYGLNWAKKAVVDAGRVVVCEGYTDVIGLQRAGVGEAVATCGTALADGHIRLLTNFARRIVLAYDADAAGQAAAERFYEWERRFEVDIRVAACRPAPTRPTWPERDPGALAGRRGRGPALPGLPAGPAVRPSRPARRPEGRARAAAEAVAMVAEHPNELVRDQYLMQVADRCRVEPDRLRQLAAETGRAASAEAGPSPGRASAAAGRRSAQRGLRLGGRRLPDGPALGRPSAGPSSRPCAWRCTAPRRSPTGWSWCCSPIPLARACFEALSAATTLHDAIEAADPQAADLLQRLAVEDTDAEADDVMIRLVERAGQRAVREPRSRDAPGRSRPSRRLRRRPSPG